jgi:hypothetical protein
MKPRIGVYLSEQMAARLAAAAKRPGTSKSALVEAALAQFLGADDDTTDLPIDRRLSLMSRQLEELDRGLRIVNGTVALQARFHLAVTPVLTAAEPTRCLRAWVRALRRIGRTGQAPRSVGNVAHAGDDGSARRHETRHCYDRSQRRNTADMLPSSKASSPHVKSGWR